MNPSPERAQALIARSRWDLAERELDAALATDPHDPMALGLLALCLAKRRQLNNARQAAREALRLAPDWAFTHHVMASVQFELEESRKAEAAAREAIRLDPSNPDHQAMLAQVHLQQRAWRKALAAAERGLALDADHVDSAKLRAAALLQLGRRADAGQVVGAALARDPLDATTHAGQGWTKLHAGDHRAALVDFREALRLDPTLELARDGLLRALKAGNPVYRLLLRYLLWGSRLGPRAHWVVFGGALIWVNGLRNWTRYNPDTRPVLIPITLVYLLFVLSVFIGEPLSTVLLSTSRYGRLLLRPEERMAAAVLVGVLLTASVPLVAGLVMANDPVFFGGVAVLALIFPSMATVMAAPGRGQVLLGVATGALCLLTAAAFTLALTGGTGAAYWLFGVVGLSGILVGVTTFGSFLDPTRTTR
jgi:Tfp pilus assembly protein PilF